MKERRRLLHNGFVSGLMNKILGTASTLWVSRRMKWKNNLCRVGALRIAILNVNLHLFHDFRRSSLTMMPWLNTPTYSIIPLVFGTIHPVNIIARTTIYNCYTILFPKSWTWFHRTSSWFDTPARSPARHPSIAPISGTTHTQQSSTVNTAASLATHPRAFPSFSLHIRRPFPLFFVRDIQKYPFISVTPPQYSLSLNAIY